jgi:tight adherence protein B
MAIILVAVFVLGACAVVGGFVTLSRLPTRMAERRMERRLQEVSIGVTSGTEEAESVIKRERSGPLPALDNFASRTVIGAGLARLIEQAGGNTTPSAILVRCGGAAVGGYVVATLFIHLPFAPVIAALVAGVVPILWLSHKRSQRLKRFEEQFPEALDLLSRAIRAGHAFQTAMSMAADELPDPVGPEFKKTFDQQNYGLPLRDALNAMTERIPIIDVRFFVTSVLIQRETGGNLSEILDNLAHVVRERFKILRQVRVHTAHGRFTGYVLMALPAALGIALSFINPDHMQLLFRERMGHIMLTGAAVMQTIGYFWIRKVIKIEV